MLKIKGKEKILMRVVNIIWLYQYLIFWKSKCLVLELRRAGREHIYQVHEWSCVSVVFAHFCSRLLFPSAPHGSETKGTCSPAEGFPCSHQVSWVREENTRSQRLKSSPSNIWKDEVNIQDPTGSLDILSVSRGFHPDPRDWGECASNYPLGKESQGTWALAIPNLPTS